MAFSDGLFQCFSRKLYMSHDMGFPTMWYMRPTKSQISLRIRAGWSEPLLVAWIFYECWATDRASFGVSKLNRRLHRLVWVYTCQNTTLLEITCHGSYCTFQACATPRISVLGMYLFPIHMPCLKSIVAQDQLASLETNWSGSSFT